VPERTFEVNRVQKTLEGATVKLAFVGQHPLAYTTALPCAGGARQRPRFFTVQRASPPREWPPEHARSTGGAGWAA
jgi:hypothetical protein